MTTQASTNITGTHSNLLGDQTRSIAEQKTMLQLRSWGQEHFVDKDWRAHFFPEFIVISFVILFNKSQLGGDFYDWLNDNYSPFQIGTYWSFGLTSLVYWLFGLIYMAVDLLERPKWIFKYKIQPYRRTTFPEYIKICKIVLRNQFLVALPVSAVYSGPLAWIRGHPERVYMKETVPGAIETLAIFAFCTMAMEISFYYVHRALHAPGRYQRFHKLHHEFAAPVALSSTYCTLTEHAFSNILPILLGIFLLNAHWSMIVMFYTILEIGTLNSHSGYALPWAGNSIRHDYHHFAFTENFGPLGLLDWFHGTEKTYVCLMEDVLKNKGFGRREGEKWALGELAKMAYEQDIGKGACASN